MTTMEIEFRRTGERRYGVTVRRDSLPPLEIGSIGYDPFMPHDLAHLIVESELGLTHGIFGFIAAGGDAGGSPHLAPGENRRAAARRRAKASRRDEKMMRKGARSDGDASERAAYVCGYEWLRRSKDPERRKRAAEMADGVRITLGNMDTRERSAYSEEALARVCARMDELSARWARLDVGDSLLLEWIVSRSGRHTLLLRA
jgi:hypothetical protein